MYLIASTKMRKAKEEMERSRPHFEAIRVEVKRIFRTVKDLESPYFYPPDRSKFVEGTYGILVITADKGLAGAYNINVIKETQKLLRSNADTRLFVVGEFGRQYFRRRNIPIEEDFHFSSEHPTLDLARKITVALLEEYNRGRLKKIFVVYTSLENRLSAKATSNRLLPFHRDYFGDKKKEEPITQEFDFVPSVNEVLEMVMDSYIAGFIHGALVDSFTAEQNSRMNAMSSANQNADDLLSDLSQEYNRRRQEVITGEIIEVSAGAMAQKRK